MKRLVPIIMAALLFACGDQTTEKPLPSLDDLRGQWVLVNYWAQWCKPCIEEIPELNALDQKRVDISVLGVNFEGATGEDLLAQEKQLGITFPTVADPSAQLAVPRPVVLPTTLLINPAGKVVSKLMGPQTEQSLEAAIVAAARKH